VPGLKRVLVAAIVAVTALAAAVTLSAAPSAASTDITPGPPSSAQCLAVVGTTGILYVGGSVPTPGTVSGDLGIGPEAPARLRLPRRITFKDARHTFSDTHAFAVRSGRMYVRKARVGVGLKGTRWHEMLLPACLDGHVRSISADGNVLTAVGPGRQLYSHDMPGGDLSAERWTWRWGPFFWTGSGMRMPPDAPTLAASELSANETFTDTAGRRHNAIGVMTGYLLRGDRRTITYIDPWLPPDASREVCGPARGRLPIASLDASGSTVFVVTRNGRLFTRLYDFDVSGANYVFGKYTWQRTPPADPDVWQLPAPDWRRQPKPRGTITDRISIATTGPHSTQRQLRVEGRDRKGRRGYWRKSLTAKRWTFVRTGKRLYGDRPARRKRILPSLDRRYLGTVGGKPAAVSDFNAACSPARLRVDVAPGLPLDLELHTEDALRQVNRARGLNDQPKRYNGAIVVPDRTWRSLPSADPRIREFVATQLDGQVTEIPVTATATRLRVELKCWTLTLDGAPARPDAPPPPDPAVLVGTLLDLAKRPAPPVCP
jgi:hypothetical protein